MPQSPRLYLSYIAIVLRRVRGILSMKFVPDLAAGNLGIGIRI